MASIAEIFRTFGSEYLHRFADDMPQEHQKAMDAIRQCRTHDAGYAYYECEQCGQLHVMYRCLRQPPLSRLSAPQIPAVA